MNRKVIFSIVVLLLLLGLTFFAGTLYEHAAHGYYFKVREKKDYETSMGPVHWSYVTESIGIPFLDPGTTIIEHEGRILYKAPRFFQESVPFAQNIVSSNNFIGWDDGEYHFHLVITTNVLKKGGAASKAIVGGAKNQ